MRNIPLAYTQYILKYINKVTSASTGYPLSVFNKNSTLKQINKYNYLKNGTVYTLDV